MRPDNKQLRQEFRKKRELIPSAKLLKWNRRLIKRLLESGVFAGATDICLYKAFRNEPDPESLMRSIRAGQPVRYYCPRTKGRRHMDFIEVNARSKFRTGRYGILEPLGKNRRILRPSSGNHGKVVFLCPGTVFDRFGGRLGSGAGYYDRVLEKFRRENKGETVFTGICWQMQIFGKALRLKPTDIRMDAVITEKNTYFNPAGYGKKENAE